MADEINNLKITMEGLSKDVSYMKLSQERIEKALSDFMTKVDVSYAGKWVEDEVKKMKTSSDDWKTWIARSVVYIGLGAIIGFLFSQLK